MHRSLAGKTCKSIIFAIVALVVCTSGSVKAEEITVGGTGYWTPYCYSTEDEPQTLKGFTVDLLNAVFKDHNVRINFIMMPWMRCLKMLDHDEVDLVMDGSRDSKRLRKYLFSDEIYKLDNSFFYLKKKFPDGLAAKNVKDIESFSLGGIKGLNYKIYPFPESLVYKGAVDIETMIKMLRYNRFDLAIGFRQIVIANAKMNDYSLKGVGHSPIPGTRPLRFYIFGNNKPKTERLIRTINKRIMTLHSNGELKKLREKYGLPQE